MTTPNTLLAAARLVDPNKPWREHNGVVYWEDEFCANGGTFDPLTNPTDAYALHLALERSGWEFWFAEICVDREANVREGFYFARYGDDLSEIRGQTAEGRYIKCVETLEAMK